MDYEIRLGNGKETRDITMRHAPRVGSELVVGKKTWRVLSVSYEVPYRIPAMSFVVKEEKKSA